MVSTPARARSAGFTLAELMAAVAILAILAAIATPSMRQLIDTQKARSTSSELFSALLRARSEAIKRNTEVTIFPVNASNWAGGWTIPNPTNSGDTIDAHGAVLSITISGPSSVVYLPNGRVKGSATPQFEVTANAKKRCVEVDLSGRPYQKNVAC